MEPCSRKLDHLIEGTHFFEKMRGARHDLKRLLGTKFSKRGAVQRKHLCVGTADNQQRRAYDTCEPSPREIWTSAAGDDCGHLAGVYGGRHESGSRSGTRSEKTDGQIFDICSLSNPPERSGHPATEQGDVKHVGAVARFLLGQKVETQRREALLTQRGRDGTIARAQTAASAAMREDHPPRLRVPPKLSAPGR